MKLISLTYISSEARTHTSYEHFKAINKTHCIFTVESGQPPMEQSDQKHLFHLLKPNRNVNQVKSIVMHVETPGSRYKTLTD